METPISRFKVKTAGCELRLVLRFEGVALGKPRTGGDKFQVPLDEAATEVAWTKAGET